MVDSTTNIGAPRCGRWSSGRTRGGLRPFSFGTRDDLDAVGSEFDVGYESGSALLGAGAGTWSKTNLRPADRVPWTRARDDDGNVKLKGRPLYTLQPLRVHTLHLPIMRKHRPSNGWPELRCAWSMWTDQWVEARQFSLGTSGPTESCSSTNHFWPPSCV
ncbi:hypothetical protein BDR06DRAFT_977730 [Suillus hirtellus]|nr:hypothetical protein BDR06DRAFT_977730 [Suillus hirtellus]